MLSGTHYDGVEVEVVHYGSQWCPRVFLRLIFRVDSGKRSKTVRGSDRAGTIVPVYPVRVIRFYCTRRLSCKTAVKTASSYPFQPQGPNKQNDNIYYVSRKGARRINTGRKRTIRRIGHVPMFSFCFAVSVRSGRFNRVKNM